MSSAELKCGGRTLKCLVLFFNLMAFIAGLTLLSGALAARFFDPVTEYLLDNESVKDTIQNDVSTFRMALYGAMVVGGIIMILGFLGCCGAWMENQIMLGVFAGLLILLLILQLVVGILVFINKNTVEDHVQTALNDLVKVVKEDGDEKNGACKVFHNMYTKLDCCGLGTKADLDNCDTMDPPLCEEHATVSCTKPLTDVIEEYSLLVGIVAVAFLVLEVVAVIFALCLCHSIRKGKEESEDY